MSSNYFHRHYNCWEVVLISLTAPFAFITAFVLEVLAQLLDSQTLFICASHLRRPLTILQAQKQYGKRLLSPSFGMHDLASIFHLRKVEAKRLDPRLQEGLFKGTEQINLYEPKGVCRGACYLFNYHLLLNLAKSEVIEVAQAIAQRFRGGMPLEAAMLHSLGRVEKKLLPLHQEFFPIDQPVMDGVYLMRLNDHMISYIQFGKTRLFWDPSVGLIEIQSELQFRMELAKYAPEKNRSFFCKQELYHFRKIKP